MQQRHQAHLTGSIAGAELQVIEIPERSFLCCFQYKSGYSPPEAYSSFHLGPEETAPASCRLPVPGDGLPVGASQLLY